MILLKDLLLEAIGSPKCIFLSGPAGSGKSYILNKLGIQGFEVLNVDTDYEELLKSTGLGTNFKGFGHDELSKAATLMAQARKSTSEREKQHIKEAKNIIIDGTGASSKIILSKKQELESLGYQTFMIMIYVNPITSLKRNQERERSLPPNIILMNWKGVVSNIVIFKESFGNNMVLINNDNEPFLQYDPEEVKRKFIDTANVTGKEKSHEELKKSLEQKAQLQKDIKSLVKVKQKFDSFDEAKSKLNTFING